MSHQGQALIESIPFFLVLFGLLGALAIFAQWFLIHQKLLMAAREGALLYSSGRFARAVVRRKVRAYLEKGPLALEGQRLSIDVGRWKGKQAKLFQLDEIKVSYKPSSWLQRYFEETMEEKCVIKHAPHYGAPYQTLYGPPVPW